MNDVPVNQPKKPCECNGFGFFYASELRGLSCIVPYHTKLLCKNCNSLSLLLKVVYWACGYRTNSQYIRIQKAAHD